MARGAYIVNKAGIPPGELPQGKCIDLCSDQSAPESEDARGNCVGGENMAKRPELPCEEVLPVMRGILKHIYEGTEPSLYLPNVLEMILQILGADRGCFVISTPKIPEMRVFRDASAQTGTAAINTIKRDQREVPWLLIRHVLRTGEPVIYSSAAHAKMFSTDQYFFRHRIRDAACVPLCFLGRSEGVLYLENRLLSSVFSAERVEVLNFFTGQVAAAIRLYAADRTKATRPSGMVEPLTKRELAILRMIAEGMSNKEIAGLLRLTVNTVKTHILNIYGKLQVNKRVQAVKKAGDLRLLLKE